jgi:peptidyl-tRNA hydrolase, PTH1 family
MTIIVGLGNPGDQYRNTRHNIGFMIVDKLAKRMGAPQFSSKTKLHGELTKQGETVFVKPTTFMNDSGRTVRAVLEYYTDWQIKNLPLHNLFVVHDDLDIPLGSYKVQLGIGPKQHNGLLSIYEHLGTEEFWHVRVGVDGRGGDRSMPPDRYVLQQPPVAEQAQLTAVTDQIVNNLLMQAAT